MANITKPVDINKIWAASGDVLAPSDTKISQGWAVEIPPRQYFNYIDGKQDQSIAHINQHGIAVWDNQTEYQANTSYTQGSNGTVYKCLITNTSVNPVGDITNSWRVAWLDSNAVTGPSVATAAQSRAQTDNTVFISPLQLSNAFTGTNQSLGANGFQVLPGGLILQWGSITTSTSGYTTFTYPKALSQLYSITATTGDNATSPTLRTYPTVGPSNLTSLQVYATSSAGSQVAVSVFVQIIGR